MVDELKTIRDFIRYSASQMAGQGVFLGHGSDQVMDEAYTLVLHALHLPFDLDGSYLDCNLMEEEKHDVLKLLAQRVEDRVPLPYLMGYIEFAGLYFNINRQVLIPRSPFAELIISGFQPWVEEVQVERVLDLCTGSGCIGIACAYAFPESEVLISDISEKALDVAQSNIDYHHCQSQVTAVKSDLFAALQDEKFDLIVSNPPYVSQTEYASLPSEYKHEPKLALETGDEGLALVTRILREARKYLTDQGVLIVEVGATADALSSRFPGVPFMWLTFENGGDGVFMFAAEQLESYHNDFMEEVE
jgi:ribosomal protein L3 glutamine methyltransferase